MIRSNLTAVIEGVWCLFSDNGLPKIQKTNANIIKIKEFIFYSSVQKQYLIYIIDTVLHY